MDCCACSEVAAPSWLATPHNSQAGCHHFILRCVTANRVFGRLRKCVAKFKCGQQIEGESDIRADYADRRRVVYTLMILGRTTQEFANLMAV